MSRGAVRVAAFLLRGVLGWTVEVWKKLVKAVLFLHAWREFFCGFIDDHVADVVVLN